MMGKRPTKKQKILMKSKHLNAENWLVCKDTPQEMLIQHRHSGQLRMIRKVQKDDKL